MALTTTTGFTVFGVHIAMVLLLVLMIIQYHRRRKYQPIRSRLYWQGEATSVMFLVSSSVGMYSAEIYQDQLCQLYPAYGILVTTCLGFLFLRAAHVFSAFEVSKLAVQVQAVQKESSNPGFFVKYASVLQSVKFQSAVIIGSFLLQSIVWALVTFGIEAGRSCGQLGIYGIISVIIAVALIVPTFYLGKNIAMLKDGLSIKRELILIGIHEVLTTVSCVTIWLLTRRPFFSILVSMGSAYIAIGIQIGMPLYLSYVWERHKHAYVFAEYSPTSSHLSANEKALESGSGLGTTPHDLEQLLFDPQVYPNFLEYCRLQLNHENPLFYKEAIPLLRRAKERAEFIETQEFSDLAHKLYGTYLAPKSKLQINLSWQQHQQVKRACFNNDQGNEHRKFNAKEAHEAIAGATGEILQLMYDDILPRYLASGFDTALL